MKRKVIVILCACSLILSPAQFVYAQTQKQEQNSLELDGQKFANEDALWEYLEKTYPTVTSTDIESGDYTGKYVLLTSIARNVDVQPTIDYVTCDMYFRSGDEKYVLDKLWCTFYDDEDMKKYGCVSGADYLASMKNDDVIEACYYINSDNSYGAMNMLAIRKIGENDGSAELSEKLQVCFYSSVPNDKTGRWRLATISTTTPIVGYALNYYKDYFKSDDEIHGIVNKELDQTYSLSIVAGQLYVVTHKYLEGEEKDASLLFGGDVISQIYIDPATGVVTIV
ncbi:hypothetical protein G7B22_06775 [Blautia sp. MSK.20.9]|nr:hypothetical protein [Blautia sp. MSK.20.9]